MGFQRAGHVRHQRPQHTSTGPGANVAFLQNNHLQPGLDRCPGNSETENTGSGNGNIESFGVGCCHGAGSFEID